MALSYYAKVAANQKKKIINILTNIPNLTTRTTRLVWDRKAKQRGSVLYRNIFVIFILFGLILMHPGEGITKCITLRTKINTSLCKSVRTIDHYITGMHPRYLFLAKGETSLYVVQTHYIFG
ncbi:hypothetical protein Pelo_14290 [Pelomyxa schiedti]|nr:hypothetical protein Pelo_14290 [Pelomyxa schiedti]